MYLEGSLLDMKDYVLFQRTVRSVSEGPESSRYLRNVSTLQHGWKHSKNSSLNCGAGSGAGNFLWASPCHRYILILMRLTQIG